MSNKQFLTIAGRWRQHAQAAGFDQLPRAEQAKAMLLFFAGFSSALEASVELADFHEAEAMHMLSALHREARLIGASAAAAAASVPPAAH